MFLKFILRVEHHRNVFNSFFLFVRNIRQTQNYCRSYSLYIRTTCFGLNRPSSDPQELSYVLYNIFVNYVIYNKYVA